MAVTALRPGHEASGTVEFHVDRRLTDAYCRRMAVTANSFWMTTLLQALHRITAMSNLVVCTFSNQRSAAEVRRTSGMLLRLLPVVSRLRDQAPEVAMQALQSQLTATMAHESYPFCMLQDALHIPFGFLYIFQEGLSLLDYPEEWSELRLTRPHDDTRICCVQVFPYVSGTKVIIEYNGTTYSRSGALCLADRWQSILQHIVSQSTNR